MKKFLLSLITVILLVHGVNAEDLVDFDGRKTTYMQVHTNAGDTIRYDIKNVSKVYYLYTDTSDVAQGVSVSGKIGDYTYVDLDLPSGKKWATYNVGASTPTEFGDYFAWGETEPKDYYSDSTYKYLIDTIKTTGNDQCSLPYYNKYTFSSGHGVYNDNCEISWYKNNENYKGDNLSTLQPEDDAATVNWGTEWRMPTYYEWEELISNCDIKSTEDYNGSGVAGLLFTSKNNGNTIFFPQAGVKSKQKISSDYRGYWSSTLHFTHKAYYSRGYSCQEYGYVNFYRYYGMPVRAISDSSTTPSPSENVAIYMCVNTNGDTVDRYDVNDVAFVDYETVIPPAPFDTTQEVTESGRINFIPYVDLGLESGLKWATYNVGADKPTEYGKYYAWGESFGNKMWYTEIEYKFYDVLNSSANETKYTKYVLNKKYGYVDSLRTLQPKDDVATVYYGENWRMPTDTEMEELINGCIWVWTDSYRGSGISGIIGSSKVNGNIIFLPASGGFVVSNELIVNNLADNVGHLGAYWTSCLARGWGFYETASCLRFTNSSISMGDYYNRYHGNTVRAVSDVK